MYAAASTRISLPQWIKLALVAATLMLTLGIGMTGAAQRVGATVPQGGSVSTQGTGVLDVNTDDLAAKPNNGSNKGKGKKHTVCYQLSAAEWEAFFAEKTDAGGILCWKE